MVPVTHTIRQSTPGQSEREREREISKFNGTSTPKGSYSAKTGVNCTMNLSRVY